MKLTNIIKLDCKRCNHTWIPRKEEILMCPTCKSRLWNVEKEVKE